MIQIYTVNPQHLGTQFGAYVEDLYTYLCNDASAIVAETHAAVRIVPNTLEVMVSAEVNEANSELINRFIAQLNAFTVGWRKARNLYPSGI